jgi:TP901 family phage tail tape measure protein
MIRDFEVGAVLTIVDDATGPLRKILEAVREVTKAVKLARTEMAGFGAAVAPGIGGAIAGVDTLAGAWRLAAESSVVAARIMTEQAAIAGRAARSAAATSGVPGVAAPGAGRRALGSRLSGGGGFGGGAHITGPGVPLPGGSHVRVGGNAAMVGAGALGWGIYEDAEMQKGIHWINYHLGRKDSNENNAQIREILEQGMIGTGFSLHDVVEAATDEARLMKGTPGVDTVGAMPEFIRAAAAEALAKDTTLKESMKSILGMAHMVKAYTPAEIKRLIPAFAYLSTANPASLGAMEKAFSYAVPILQSGADVDPITTMLLGTALSTAGVTSTKSGTWLREMVKRGMPGDDKHNAALKQLGLIDDSGKPTWFTDGKPDPVKLLEIAGPKAANIPVADRIGVEHQIFGTQGSGAFAVLADDKVLARLKELRKEMEGEDFKNRYGSIMEDYKGTAVGTAKTTLSEFTVTLMRLGDTVLPAVTGALRDFTSVLQGIRALIPGSDANKWQTGTHAIAGAGLGAAIGLPFGQPLLGAAIGAGLTLAPGTINKGVDDAPKALNWGVDAIPKALNAGVDALIPNWLKNTLQGPPPKAVLPPITMNLNVDGDRLASTVVEHMQNSTEHATSSPNYNALSNFGRADGGLTTE